MDNNINSIQNILKSAKKQLFNIGIETYSLDAELLLMHVLSFSKVELITKGNTELKPAQQKKYNTMVQRRLQLEPVQYIINNAEFMGLKFYVNQDVLIPRSDTECLVELVIEYINKHNCKSVLDMCTGSGCIPISLLNFCKQIDTMVAVDISQKALHVAKENANTHSVLTKINFIKSDMFTNVPNNMQNSIDIIVSNPPYIDTKDINSLGINVKNYEPTLALDGKEQGLYFYNILAEKANFYLKPNGKLFMEIGFNQGNLVKEIFLKHGYTKVEVKKDLSGLDRVIVVDR